MKIRTSFVTNSSSSSFIIAVKDNGILSNSSSVLGKFARRALFGEAEIIKTKEEYINFLAKEYYILSEEIEEGSSDSKALSFLEKGYVIVYRNVDNNDESANDLLSSLPTEGEDSDVVLLGGEY